MTSYADLEIRILELHPQGYPVELTLNFEQEFPRGFLDPTGLPWKAGLNPARDGERLFNWLFEDERLKNAWSEVRGQSPQRRVRLRLDAAAPELHLIPWELLCEPGEGGLYKELAAGTATPFSRYLACRGQPGGPVLHRPVKILAAFANPAGLDEYGLDPVDVDREWELLQKAVEGQSIELSLLPQPCTLAGVEKALKDGYHILHFAGHGLYSKVEQSAFLFLSDEDNQVCRVSGAEFSRMLSRHLGEATASPAENLRLVFLASCQTAQTSPADTYRGLAQQLVAAGVPVVLAMQDLVPVVTARQFVETFYRQLLRHGLADLASNEARSSILSAGLMGGSIPVLYSRLRGSQVLGQRGRVSNAREKTFWPFLVENILRGQCTAFLGPGVTQGLLPDRETAAKKLAEKYDYPLVDANSLVRVAQFMDIYSPGLARREYLRVLRRGLFDYLDIKPTRQQKEEYGDASFTETAEGLNWAEKVVDMQENEIHHILAELRLPLYITTNFDNFMTEALKRLEGISPRRLGPRWDQVGAGSPQYVLSPKPSPQQPVVFHLNGHDGDLAQLDHLVLSEDDYIEHIIRLSRDQDAILPVNLLGLLSSQSFIFLGYQLDDWEFRTLMQGIIRTLPPNISKEKKRHVGVQLMIEQGPGADKAMEYLDRYMGRFDIDIYWGSAQQFVNELHDYRRSYLEKDNDDW
jgi:hypothetical protein